MSNSGRIPSLDGFRALSVLIVFAGHAKFYGMSVTEIGQYFSADSVFVLPARFGVTIFFFISGYIITTLMRTEFERTDTVSFRNFYLRRIYRIFPPLYITLALAALLSWAGLLRSSVTWSSVMAQILHFTNYYALLIANTRFFEGTKLLWSLAVEEHFYLVFPLFFLLLARRLSCSQIGWCMAGLCVAVLGWRCYLYFGLNISSNWAFIATDSRIDSILFGCILGVWHNPARDKPLIRQRFAAVFVLIVSLGAVVFSIVYKEPAFQRTLMFTIQGLAFLSIFSCAIRHPDWLLFRWLNWSPMVYLGWISYTFYLSHAMALKIALRYTDNQLAGYALGLAATIIFSALMFKFVETPLAKKRAATHRNELARAAAARS